MARPTTSRRPILDTVLKPLWAAYAVLKRGRVSRASRWSSTCPSAKSC